MRQIEAGTIASVVEKLVYEASYVIGRDVYDAVSGALSREMSPTGRSVLGQLLQNYDIAREERVAICQDTGMAVVFLDVGQDAHIASGDLTDAVNRGVAAAYDKGYLRKSVVRDPLYGRVNTGDNTPAMLYTRIVPGDKLDITVAPKGFGSENMSAVRMLVPADGEEGVVRFIVDTVVKAGPNPCPPVIVGVGIGGTMEMAALTAKRMLTRPLSARNPDARYAALEDRLLSLINKSGVGPGGMGGANTALRVHIGVCPTHIAGLPVAVNLCCHAARHAHAVI